MFVRMIQLMFLLPMVMQIVRDIEDVAAGKTGKEKKAAGMQAINAITDSLERMGFIDRTFNDGLDQTAGAVIDAIVGVYNTLGIFAPAEEAKEVTGEDAGGGAGAPGQAAGAPSYDETTAKEQDIARVDRMVKAGASYADAKRDRERKLGAWDALQSAETPAE